MKILTVYNHVKGQKQYPQVLAHLFAAFKQIATSPGKFHADKATVWEQFMDLRVEMIGPIWLAPPDSDRATASVLKNGAADLCRQGLHQLWRKRGDCRANRETLISVYVRRVGYASLPCPPSPAQEDQHYANDRTIAGAAYDLVTGKP